MIYIVATPIGNLEDISLRAKRILSECDFILCEDTRVTSKLLARYGIKTSLLSYHHHSQLSKMEEIFNLVERGKNLALVSDAGTPGISDPGNKLISFLRERIPDLKVAVVPGPSALVAAASVSGFPMDKFLFFGFLPVKNKRKKALQEIIDSKYPVIFFESKYKIIRTLEELGNLLDKEIVVCQELTKMFETIYRGKISQVLEKMKKSTIKGEFVVIIR